MAGLLSSPRRRRRILRVGGTIAVAGGLAGVFVHWSNTGHSEDLPVSTVPARVAPQPRLVPRELVGARRAAASATVAQFLEDGVRGRSLDTAWSLVSPGFRAGFTRGQWRSGTTPIVPYAYRSYRVAVAAAYADRVELEVRALPAARSGQRPQTFSLELTQAGSGERARWLVSYWEPETADAEQPGRAAAPDPSAPPDRATLGAEWLLLPVGLLGGTLLLLAGFGVRGWWRGARATRAYRARRERLF